MSQEESTQMLGNLIPSKFSFHHIDVLFAELNDSSFLEKSEIHRLEKIHEELLKQIQNAPKHAFLLSAIVEYIQKVEESRLLSFPYSFTLFEAWLSEHHALSQEEQLHIRGKIMGKWIPRREYQAFFPVGGNQFYPGPHIVSAHRSPDVDSAIASFWGWVDAFSAQVAEGRHIWNLPEGFFPQHVERLFKQLFGESFMDLIPRRGEKLRLTALDLMTQVGFVKKRGAEKTREIMHERGKNCVILVDGEGYYLGDWRTSDVESVRWVVFLFTSCLHWFSSHVQEHLFALFAYQNLHVEQVRAFIRDVLALCMEDMAPAREFSSRDRELLDICLKEVLDLPRGISSSFSDLAEKLFFENPKSSLSSFVTTLRALESEELFDERGRCRENRVYLFSHLQKVMRILHQIIHHIRSSFERLDVAIQIKQQVLGVSLEYVTPEDELDEIRRKMKSYHYLVVAHPEKKQGRLVPFGIIRAQDLHKTFLGTVSLRDFCNGEEISCPPYLELISVVDHHKIEAKTAFPPTALVADVQSSNVLVAEQLLQINEKYSTGGLSQEFLQKEWQRVGAFSLLDEAEAKRASRLLQRQLALFAQKQFSISSQREIAECLSLLYAIFDDTDLLQKVSDRDVISIAKIINRLKSIQEEREIELLHFDDIAKDALFAKNAAKRILQHEEVYSLYEKIYRFRQDEIAQQIEEAADGRGFALFSDTKEQNGCARVGQTKMFSSHHPLFSSVSNLLRGRWLQRARETSSNFSNLDFHLHMISTIPDAQETYRGENIAYCHRDEIWIWVVNSLRGKESLARFLRSFSLFPLLSEINMEVLLFGQRAEEWMKIVSRHIPLFPRQILREAKEEETFLVLQFNAGALNSRKAAITPFLPSH